MNKSTIIFFNPEKEEDYKATIEIFNEYQQYLGVDLCFQQFENELNNLNSIYKKPAGTIILAKVGHEIAGCIALKPIEKDNCEMKRLFVKPAHRGLGIGTSLVEMLIEFAKTAKYKLIKLDTLTNLSDAIALYQKYGFENTNPYVYNPLENVLYFEKKL